MDRAELDKRLRSIHRSREEATLQQHASESENREMAKQWLQKVAEPALKALRDALNDTKSMRISVGWPTDTTVSLELTLPSMDRFSFTVGVHVSGPAMIPTLWVNGRQIPTQEIGVDIRKWIRDWTPDDVQAVFLQHYGLWENSR